LPAETTRSWFGTLTIAEAGTYRLHLQVLGCDATLRIDGQVVAKNGLMWIHGDVTQASQDNILPTLDGLDNLRAAVKLSAGPHRIDLSVAPDGSHRPVQVRLNWVTPSKQHQDFAAAIEAARHARAAVVFAWSRGRPTFGLPGDQDKLIEAVSAVNPNTIVVLNIGQPVALPWLPKVKAILQMWWPGNEGGTATANLLVGKSCPAGRLPFTWPVRLEDMPATDPAHPERTGHGDGEEAIFSEGVLVGYRWLDDQKKQPLFPFGFGLSYSSFAYSGLAVGPAADGGLDAKISVSNTGKIRAEEVVQLYVGRPSIQPVGVQFAPQILGGFERVMLEPGETRQVQIHVALRQMQYWSTREHRWMTPPGERTIWAGGSSRDHHLQVTVSTETLSAMASRVH
jgi:beta-glucosidase